MSGLLPSKENKEGFSKQNIDRLFVFSMMWSFGAFLELDDRKKLQDFMYYDLGYRLDFPKWQDGGADDTMFDYYVNEEAEWCHWNTKVQEYVYPTDHTPEYGSILVPNVDNVRTDFLINTIAKQGKVN